MKFSFDPVEDLTGPNEDHIEHIACDQQRDDPKKSFPENGPCAHIEIGKQDRHYGLDHQLNGPRIGDDRGLFGTLFYVLYVTHSSDTTLE